MNNARRKRITALRDKAYCLQDELEAILEEEQEARDNIPESLQGSERYERAEESCYRLEDALETLTSFIDEIEEAKE